MSRKTASKRTAADELSYLRSLINMQLKQTAYLTDRQEETLKSMQQSLKGKRKISDAQVEYTKDVLSNISERVGKKKEKEHEKWLEKQEKQFTRKMIKKYGYNPYRDNPVKPRKAPEKYDKNDDYYFRYLGISKYETVTLSDGTMYTLEDLKKAFEQVGINAKDTFFKTNIQEFEYDPKKYNRFIKKAEDKIDKLLTDKRLSARDIEGMKKLMGIKGANASIKYD